MRRLTFLISGFILVAFTTILLLAIYTELQQGETATLPLVSIAADGNREVLVATALSVTELELATGQVARLAGLRVPAPTDPFAEGGRAAAQALTAGVQVRVEGPLEAAFVYLPDGQLLQAILVADGYVQVTDGLPNDARGETLRLAQVTAQSNGYGIWSDIERVPLPTPPPQEAIVCDKSLVPNSINGPEAMNYIGQQQAVVLLPIKSVSRSNGLLLLGGLTEEDFGIVLSAEIISTGGEAEAQFLNHCLVATGTVERDITSTGVRIVVRDTAQVLILR